VGEIDASIPLQGRPVQMPPLDIRGTYATLGQLKLWAAQGQEAQMRSAVLAGAEQERNLRRAVGQEHYRRLYGTPPNASPVGAQLSALNASSPPPLGFQSSTISGQAPTDMGVSPAPGGGTMQRQLPPEQLGPMPPGMTAGNPQMDQGAPQGPPGPPADASDIPQAAPVTASDAAAAVANHPVYQMAMAQALLGPTTGGAEYAGQMMGLQKSQLDLTASRVDLATRLLQSVDPSNPGEVADYIQHMQLLGLPTGNLRPPPQWDQTYKSRLLQNGLTVLQSVQEHNKAWQNANEQYANQIRAYEAQRPYIPPGMQEPYEVTPPPMGAPAGTPSTGRVLTVPGGAGSPPSGATSGATSGAAGAGTPQRPLRTSAMQGQIDRQKGVYLDDTKDVRDVVTQYQNVMKGLSLNNAVGDKMVMDGFSQMAANTNGTRLGMLNFMRGMGNVVDQAQAWYQSHFTAGAGELSPNIRAQIKTAIHSRLITFLNDYIQRRGTAVETAARSQPPLPGEEVAPPLLNMQGNPRHSRAALDQIMQAPGIKGRLTEGDVLADILQRGEGFQEGAR